MSTHPLFMKMVYHIQELLAHKGGPDPCCLETQSHIYAIGTTVIPNDSVLLQGKDDGKCKVVKNGPTETRNAKEVVPKEGKISLKGKEF